jgi:hypothetical protein
MMQLHVLLHYSGLPAGHFPTLSLSTGAATGECL